MLQVSVKFALRTYKGGNLEQPYAMRRKIVKAANQIKLDNLCVAFIRSESMKRGFLASRKNILWQMNEDATEQFYLVGNRYRLEIANLGASRYLLTFLSK